MKELFIIITSVLIFTSCDFSTIEFEIKKIAEIPGNIDSLPNNSQLNIICYSGFQEKQKNVWTQCIAIDTITKAKYRIITPQFFKTRIHKTMTYQQITRDDILLASALSGLNTDTKSKSLNELIHKAKEAKLSEAFEQDTFDNIQIFFNPRFTKDENQTLPIIIGKLE